MGQLHQPTSKSRSQSLTKLKARALELNILVKVCSCLGCLRIFPNQMPSLLKNILGQEPKRKISEYYFYGRNKGSLVVRIAGEKQGLWYDFQTGEGGNLLQLIQSKLGLNFKQALEHLKNHEQHRGYKNNLQAVLCLDNDGNNAATNKGYIDTAQKLAQAGQQVWLAKDRARNNFLVSESLIIM